MNIRAFNKSYDGDRNPLISLLYTEMLLGLANSPKMTEDSNDLDCECPSGSKFRIFVDAGDFDYFEWFVLPDETRLDYGHPALRELEFHWGEPEGALFRDAVRW